MNLPRNSGNADLASDTPLDGVDKIASNHSTTVVSERVQAPSMSDKLLPAANETSNSSSMTLKRSGRSLYHRLDAKDAGKWLSRQEGV